MSGFARRAGLLGLCALIGAGSAASPALAGLQVDRPSMTGFYAADEGSRIVLKANYCGALDAKSTDSYSVVFRVWDRYGKVFERRVSGRPYSSCGWAAVYIPDGFPSGIYRANAAIVDRTRGGSFRNAARSFSIY